MIITNKSKLAKGLHKPTRHVDLEDMQELKAVKLLLKKALAGCPDGIAIASNQVCINTKKQALNCFYYHNELYYNAYYRAMPTSVLIDSQEGCLSHPGALFNVKRHSEIAVGYNDGKAITLTGLPAIVFQHEIDHLNGICIWDKQPSLNEHGGN